MIKIFKALKYTSLFVLTSFTFIGCDNEFNTVDSDVLGEENFNFKNSTWVAPIVSYNKKITSHQVNNLNSNLLGFHDDPIYGKTTASLITQLALSSESSDFGDEAVIDSVILNIPYFNRVIGQTTKDDLTYNTYTLSDSIYGDESKPVKLSIYRNGYFLSDFNPNSDTNEVQNYYSDASNADRANNYAKTETTSFNFDDHKTDLIYQSDASGYIPNHNALILTTGTGDSKVRTAFAPALRLNLANDDIKKNYWKETILDKAESSELSNTNNFKNYFRGLYFKAEAISNAGQMILLNTNSTDAKITIYYSNNSTTGTYTLNLSGAQTNKVNTFINDFDKILIDGDTNVGDEKLYLKGAEGSMAVVDLFKGTNSECGSINPLECFKNTYRQRNENNYILKDGETVDENGYVTKNGDFILKRLINEAQLVIFEHEIMSTLPKDNNGNDYSKYDRIYAYDIKNNIPTVDYTAPFDPSENTSDPKNSKIISLGQRLTDNNKYKIRITEHLNNILIKDSTNTKLGLVISNNVNIISNSKILNSDVSDAVTKIPTATILSPRGTVLHGSNSSNDNKKMKLEIFSTEIKE